ncbi:BTA121 domain-containing protein surface lipoprotein [Borrelia crocidurae]|uniref:Lipoprotein n=1 Tax=Borrelia crocidurae (strain Achema) TaxID=1155096 RepID=I0FEE1_BORCA|nr:hypothetical protein [Borrelia crocidurae]AFI31847.1 hypothetical protein Q7M_1139 [Borrelia crocidurae str. Achema]
MVRGKDFFLLLLLVLMVIDCNLKSPKVLNSEIPSNMGFVSKKSLKQDSLFNTFEDFLENSVEIIDIDVNKLLDKFKISNEGKELILYIKKLLCDPDVVDNKIDYKIYTKSEFCDLLNNLGSDGVYALRKHLWWSYSLLKKAEAAVKAINNNVDSIEIAELQFELYFNKNDYHLSLGKIFSESNIGDIYDNIVNYENRFVKSFVDIQQSALEMIDSENPDVNLGVKSFVKLTEGLSVDEQKAIKYIKQIIVDPNTRACQFCIEYSDDNFDALLSNWTFSQIQRLARMGLKYLEMRDDIEYKINNLDKIGEIEATKEVQNRIKSVLTLLKDTFMLSWSTFKNGYPLYLQNLFDKSTAAEVYKSIPSLYFLFDPKFAKSFLIFNYVINYYYNAMHNLPVIYNKLSDLEKKEVEDMRLKVVDSSVNSLLSEDTVGDDEFYSLLGDGRFFLPTLYAHIKIMKIIKEKNNFLNIIHIELKDSNMLSKVSSDFDDFVLGYPEYLKQLFLRLKKDNKNFFNFTDINLYQHDYKGKFEKIMNKVWESYNIRKAAELKKSGSLLLVNTKKK